MYKTLTTVIMSSAVLLGAYAYADDDAIVAIERAPAEYPKKAHKKCIEGNVIVKFVITSDGTTTELEVVSSRPEGVFEKAALAAVAKWRFEPRILNGLPVQRETSQRLVFEPGCTS